MSLPFCVLSASAQDPTPATPQITIGGNVYGGGDRGEVDGNTNVTIKSVTLGSEPTTGGVVTGGNVYGGGNKGDLSGQTTVTLQGGNIRGSVFGGACEANVGKTTYVNVDGENQVHDLIVNYVYGGNDISGTIGASLDKTDVGTDKVRFTPEVNTGSSTVVNNLFQAYIKTTPEATGMHTYIGQMFGGGNGDYYYNLVNDAGDSKTYNVFRQEPDDPTVVDENDPNYLGQVGSKPELSKTYLQINGGTYGYVYAGGNAVTVQENAVISWRTSIRRIWPATRLISASCPWASTSPPSPTTITSSASLVVTTRRTLRYVPPGTCRKAPSTTSTAAATRVV